MSLPTCKPDLKKKTTMWPYFGYIMPIISWKKGTLRALYDQNIGNFDKLPISCFHLGHIIVNLRSHP